MEGPSALEHYPEQKVTKEWSCAHEVYFKFWESIRMSYRIFWTPFEKSWEGKASIIANSSPSLCLLGSTLSRSRSIAAA